MLHALAFQSEAMLDAAKNRAVQDPLLAFRGKDLPAALRGYETASSLGFIIALSNAAHLAHTAADAVQVGSTSRALGGGVMARRTGDGMSGDRDGDRDGEEDGEEDGKLEGAEGQNGGQNGTEGGVKEATDDEAKAFDGLRVYRVVERRGINVRTEFQVQSPIVRILNFGDIFYATGSTVTEGGEY
jgi:hypothetical protein